MQNSVTNRPRPVTATVTKPKWMQIPTQDDQRRFRSKSLESNGSTASLTSLLDHDSYNSASDNEGSNLEKVFNTTYSQDEIETIEQHQQQAITENENRSPRVRQTKSKSPNQNLSAWELWVIEKAKGEQERRQKESFKKMQERAEKEKKEQEKHVRILKAETECSSWLRTKNEEMKLKKKMEKLKIEMEKRQKKEIEAQIKKDASEKFDKWQILKKEEEKEKMKKIKEENKEKKQHELQRKLDAEEKFQQWLKMAHNRPKTAPNSFGYLSGKVTGYHDRNAYPEPTFCNPIPWQSASIPSSQSIEKKNRMKPYKWNPEKYL
uniref:Coiled-coil domain-containing protein n=1 Tax=Arion vulgaris TaxID=1028688 RepID=A0A0B6Y8X6_9EUPU